MSPARPRRLHPVDVDVVRARLTVAVPAARVFAVLADPATHAAIDGTGWVRHEVDPTPLTAVGQAFRMGMSHPDHPDGRYRTANEVLVLGPARTEVTLTYGWSAVPPSVREYLTFPPFDAGHLARSLRHLAGIAAERS